MSTEVAPFPQITAAIRSGDAPLMRALFERFPDMRSLAVPGFGTWLHYASANGTLDIVRELVAMGFDVNSVEDDGLGPLKNAAYEDREDIARYLLEQGAPLDVSSSARNPLFGAIVGRSPGIARLLLDHGIDSTIRYDSATMTDMDAVAFALMRGEGEIARMVALRNAGGDADAAEAALAEGRRIAVENAGGSAADGG